MFVREFVLFEKLGKMTARQWCFAGVALAVTVGLLIYLAKSPRKSGGVSVRTGPGRERVWRRRQNFTVTGASRKEEKTAVASLKYSTCVLSSSARYIFFKPG